ncbi:restriction endonuclease subunit S [Actinocrinis puniceicyclus]|uniref:Restriction endonuclease subunit S n=1 Tax=Actinocrinis puniceicyclus TaxID=977794 RepID=A0A8J7WR22_9ACTN|nr:restriction endonuclease subunit S [Actinocrinis puniceicyclus]MBS2963960.1 restriction endonuclease subunit S [Actinocrinis puniceicyclus]
MPEGWEVVTLADEFELASGKPARGDRVGYIPVYGGNGVNGRTSEALTHCSTLVIGRVGEYCGSIYLTDGPAWITDNALWARRISDGWDLRFATSYLRWRGFSQVKSQTGQPLVTQGQIGKMRMPKPPLGEQRRIAEILDAIDEQIAIVVELRRKTEAKADGVFTRLFSTGGEFDSAVVPLRDAAKWLSGGTPNTGTPEFWDGDIPWISAASLKDFYISSSSRSVTALGVSSGSRVVPPGTTICIVRGMSLKNEFRVGVTTKHVAFGQDCKALIPVDGIDPWYLGYSVRALEPKVLTLVDEAGHGTGRLETPLLEKLDIHVPDITAQARKVRIAQAVENEINIHKVELAKLAKLKSALMDDLLTGRVRVPVETKTLAEV